MPLSKEDLGKLIKEARKIKASEIKQGFTQADLAKAVKKSRSYIGDIEAGRTYPNYTLLSEIAKACGVPLSFFEDEVTYYSENNDINNTNSKVKEDESIYRTEYTFTNPQEAIKFILSQPTIMGFGGFDINKMSDEDVVDFANDLLSQLKLLSYKYKK